MEFGLVISVYLTTQVTDFATQIGECIVRRTDVPEIGSSPSATEFLSASNLGVRRFAYSTAGFNVRHLWRQEKAMTNVLSDRFVKMSDALGNKAYKQLKSVLITFSLVSGCLLVSLVS
jgi:hypothetical protein